MIIKNPDINKSTNKYTLLHLQFIFTKMFKVILSIKEELVK